MKAILQLFKDYGFDCDLDVNNHLMFYNSDDDIVCIEHAGELLIEEYLDNTTIIKDGETVNLDGRDTVTILFDGDYSLALETIIENEKSA